MKPMLRGVLANTANRSSAPSITVPTEISGTAYPGETIYSTNLGQWYINGAAVSGETGSTYVVRVTDIGKALKQAGSNVLTVWHPNNVANVQLVLLGNLGKKSLGVESVEGGLVSEWQDLKNGWHASQATDSAKPVARKAFINGNDVIQCDGVDDILNLASGSLSIFNGKANGYVMACIRPTDLSVGPQHVVYFSTGTSAGANRVSLAARGGGSSNFSAYARATDAGSVSTASSASSTGWHVLTSKLQWGTTVALRVDGAQTSTASLPTAVNTLSSLAASIGGITGSCFKGYLGGAFVVNGVLTAEELSQLERYLGMLVSVNIPLILPEPDDTGVTNYKSGISLNWGGTQGVDYAEEYLYHDKRICPKKVVYIKAATPILSYHNSRNIAGKADGSDAYETVPTSVGVIKYKVDGDQRYGLYPQSWTTMPAITDFASLNYGLYGDPGTQVVGTTGETTAATLANKSTRYCRGVLDSVGDEWHTLTMADDDSAYAPSVEYKSSDGKIWMFVVNPKTPCLTFRVTGNGQFYTTPPKTYFIPYIYAQTTHIYPRTGTVTVEISDINGNNISYRINGGSFINAGASSVILTSAAFADGSNTLEYYYAGNAAYTKTRTVVKNPAYPSAGETHGNRLWVDATTWTTEVRPKLLGNPDKFKWIDLWRKGSAGYSAYSRFVNGYRSGSRTNGADSGACLMALLAKIYGMTYKYGAEALSKADLAKMGLLETRCVLDPIGIELNLSNNLIPTRELNFRGYYDVPPIYSAAAAYDILIGDYRENQGFSNGMTPIEDLYIRDMLASYSLISGMWTGGWNATDVYHYNDGTMGDTAKKTATAMIACMIPSYSSPYYGTSGADGATTTTYSHVVFPTLNHTWYDLYLDNNVSLEGYPGVTNKMGLNDYLFLSDGTWNDRIPYAGTALMGRVFGLYYVLLKLFHSSKTLPNMDAAMVNSVAKTLMGNKFSAPGDELPKRYLWSTMQNSYFPSFRSGMLPYMTPSGIDTEYNTGGIWNMFYHDLDLPLGPA